MNQLLQAHVTVEDDGVFTMPWTTSSLLHRGVSTVLTTPFGPLRVTHDALVQGRAAAYVRCCSNSGPNRRAVSSVG